MLEPGTRIGPYEVIARLGAGDMGEVYRARDPRLGREVALKLLVDGRAADEHCRARFEQEARLAGTLDHPNLVTVHDVGQHDGKPYLVTELLEGQTLRARLSAGPVPQALAVDIAAQVAEGLAAAHAKGIVHRDVKPENVVVGRDGRVKVIDFGIAKLLPSPHDTTVTDGKPHTATV